MFKQMFFLIPLFITGCAPMLNEAFIKPYQEQRNSAATQLPPNSNFSLTDAKTMLEICIELNNQDDRNNNNLSMEGRKNSESNPIDWALIYDSRDPNTQHSWNNRWADAALNDVKQNGMEPLNNAWLLAKSTKEDGHYAIAIRGTVAEWQNIMADAYATTIPAYAGIEYPQDKPLPIVFASTPKAEVHLGFAYASLALLFDDDQGILSQLKTIRDIKKLTITGHSQGAAVATLVHAFLYYAIADNQIPYGLDNLKNIPITSYLFAQPKPGNLQFAQDFARIAPSNAFVINNDRDPVPQVPLSRETISEVATYVEEDNDDVAVGDFGDRMIAKITSIKNNIRGSFAEIPLDMMVHKFTERGNINKSIDEYFGKLKLNLEDSKAKSLNYTMAGQLKPLFGIKEGIGLYPKAKVDGENKKDILLQHHATSYRKLIAEQLK